MTVVGLFGRTPRPEREKIVEFRRSLEEALLWCRSRFSMYDLAGSLRSSELKPAADLFDPERTKEIVDNVIARRRRLLEKSVPQPDRERCSFWGYQRSDQLAAQHLLAVFPEESLSDGTSPPPTGGFVDENDVPAWDTWLYFDTSMLVTLVPPELVSAVEPAILANAYDCIGWLGFRDHLLVNDLHREGLPEIKLHIRT
jgi:hypothetical protein